MPLRYADSLRRFDAAAAATADIFHADAAICAILP